jgi:hypothetical protein
MPVNWMRRPRGLSELIGDRGLVLYYPLGRSLSLLFHTSQWIKGVRDPDIGKIEVRRVIHARHLATTTAY